MKVVADANVLLAALAGGAAGKVLKDPSVEVVAPAAALAEVEEYLPVFAKQKGLDETLLRMTLASLPVEWIEGSAYVRCRAEAERRIGERDPDDVDLVALCLSLNAPAWSNDNDLEVAQIEWYTTAELLAKLGHTRRTK